MELELIKQVSEFGILGVILALVWWIALRLWRELQGSWEARLSESKQLTSVIETTNRSYAALASATEGRAKANEAMSQAQEASSRVLEAQVKTLDRVLESQERLSREMDRLSRKIDRLSIERASGEPSPRTDSGRKARL